uniref:Uncharacterized protein n=1 Tax=Rhizophora mucronata TaxID=61149 RepID=A0A2P2PYF4_RHIMU
MHISSTVRMYTCWDVRRSAFPVGTISRAPKVCANILTLRQQK